LYKKYIYINVKMVFCSTPLGKTATIHDGKAPIKLPTELPKLTRENAVVYESTIRRLDFTPIGICGQSLTPRRKKQRLN
jgi:hypothetical protein